MWSGLSLSCFTQRDALRVCPWGPNGRTSFFLISEQYSIVSLRFSLPSRPSVRGHVGCLCARAVTSRAAVNMGPLSCLGDATVSSG